MLTLIILNIEMLIMSNLIIPLISIIFIYFKYLIDIANKTINFLKSKIGNLFYLIANIYTINTSNNISIKNKQYYNIMTFSNIISKLNKLIIYLIYFNLIVNSIIVLISSFFNNIEILSVILFYNFNDSFDSQLLPILDLQLIDSNIYHIDFNFNNLFSLIFNDYNQFIVDNRDQDSDFIFFSNNSTDNNGSQSSIVNNDSNSYPNNNNQNNNNQNNNVNYVNNPDNNSDENNQEFSSDLTDSQYSWVEADKSVDDLLKEYVMVEDKDTVELPIINNNDNINNVDAGSSNTQHTEPEKTSLNGRVSEPAAETTANGEVQRRYTEVRVNAEAGPSNYPNRYPVEASGSITPNHLNQGPSLDRNPDVRIVDLSDTDRTDLPDNLPCKIEVVIEKTTTQTEGPALGKIGERDLPTDPHSYYYPHSEIAAQNYDATYDTDTDYDTDSDHPDKNSKVWMKSRKK